MILSVTDNRIREEKRLMPAVLGCVDRAWETAVRQHPPVISLVGGGGKTTCVLTLAGECLNAGIGAVVATTTHMQMPFDQYLLETEDMEALRALMAREGQVWLGKRLPPEDQTVRHKSRSLSEDFIRQVCRKSGAPVIIEADGARCLPCKAPGEREPVLVPETTHLISVCGLDALGQKISDCSFRPELVASITGKAEEGRLTGEDLVRLALSEQGGRKGAREGMRYLVVLNKADNDALRDEARDIAGELTARGVERVLITCGLQDRAQA